MPRSCDHRIQPTLNNIHNGSLTPISLSTRLLIKRLLVGNGERSSPRPKFRHRHHTRSFRLRPNVYHGKCGNKFYSTTIRSTGARLTIVNIFRKLDLIIVYCAASIATEETNVANVPWPPHINIYGTYYACSSTFQSYVHIQNCVLAAHTHTHPTFCVSLMRKCHFRVQLS